MDLRNTILEYLNPAGLECFSSCDGSYTDYYLSDVAKKYEYDWLSIEPIVTEELITNNGTESAFGSIKYEVFLACEDSSPVASILPNRIFIQPATRLSGTRDDNALISLFSSMLADDLKLRLYSDALEPVWIAAVIKGKELSIFDDSDFLLLRFSDLL